MAQGYDGYDDAETGDYGMGALAVHHGHFGVGMGAMGITAYDQAAQIALARGGAPNAPPPGLNSGAPMSSGQPTNQKAGVAPTAQAFSSNTLATRGTVPLTSSLARGVSTLIASQVTPSNVAASGGAQVMAPVVAASQNAAATTVPSVGPMQVAPTTDPNAPTASQVATGAPTPSNLSPVASTAGTAASAPTPGTAAGPNYLLFAGIGVAALGALYLLTRKR